MKPISYLLDEEIVGQVSKTKAGKKRADEEQGPKRSQIEQRIYQNIKHQIFMVFVAKNFVPFQQFIEVYAYLI